MTAVIDSLAPPGDSLRAGALLRRTGMRAVAPPFEVLDEFPDPVIVADRGGAVVYASSAATSLFAVAGSSLIGQELAQLCRAEDRGALRRSLATALESPATVRLGVSLSGPEGTRTRSLDLALHAIGRAERALVLVSVRAGHDSVAAAHPSDRDIYRRVVESTRDGIWLVDANAQTTLVNTRMATMLGHTPVEMIGRPAALFIDLDPEELARLGERRRRGVTEAHEMRLRHKNGEVVQALVVSNPLRDVDGSFTGSLGVVTDLSESGRIERQLLQAQKMEAVGRLAGGIAHEFNNLLTTIIGASELLGLRLVDQPELRSEVHGIRTATDRAASLVRRLLTFARRQNVNPRVVDLRGAVNDAHRILASALGEEIDLDVQAANQPCTARADVAQVEQMLLNLVINARDAMPEGGRVVVSVARRQLEMAEGEVPRGDYVVIAVQDSGVGMTADVLARIFEPFFTTKRREYGSGLGLSIVYGIIQQSGGHIRVQSCPGQGSTFSIYLPFVEAEAEDHLVHEAADEVSIPRGDETVLVVEDDELVRGITVRALRAMGYRILLAEDGEDALQVVERHGGRIDLVVTDVAMPRMGGPELADRLTERHPNLKVLFVSGYSEEELSERGVLAANRAFLDKPFTSSMLGRKLREILDR